jgi:hypothetical protein
LAARHENAHVYADADDRAYGYEPAYRRSRKSRTLFDLHINNPQLVAADDIKFFAATQWAGSEPR